MQLSKQDIDFCKTYNADKYPHPSLTADTVLFRIIDQLRNSKKKYPTRKLEILLVRRAKPPFSGGWALPGGFCHMDEDTSVCAARELKEETGLEGRQLGQIAAFSAPQRDPRTRVVSVAYLALCAYDVSTVPRADDDAVEARWFTVECTTKAVTPDCYETELTLKDDELVIRGVLSHMRENTFAPWRTTVKEDAELLAFDHLSVIACGVESLRDRIYTTSAAFLCVPEVFRIADLQSVFEAVMGQELLRSTFYEHVKPRIRRMDQASDIPIPEQCYQYNELFTLPDGSSAVRIINQ